jgi:hypothetical protein
LGWSAIVALVAGAVLTEALIRTALVRTAGAVLVEAGATLTGAGRTVLSLLLRTAGSERLVLAGAAIGLLLGLLARSGGSA